MQETGEQLRGLLKATVGNSFSDDWRLWGSGGATPMRTGSVGGRRHITGRDQVHTQLQWVFKGSTEEVHRAIDVRTEEERAMRVLTCNDTILGTYLQCPSYWI